MPSQVFKGEIMYWKDLHQIILFANIKYSSLDIVVLKKKGISGK